MNFGSRGTYFNAGIPGTGLYARERIDGPAPRATVGRTPPERVTLAAKVVIDKNDGSIKFLHEDGTPLPDSLVAVAKRQNADQIRNGIERAVEEMNAISKQLGEIHLTTPAPTDRIRFQPRAFEEPAPAKPVPEMPGLLARLFKSVAKKVDERNAEKERRYQEQLTAWSARRNDFEEAEREREDFLERRIFADVGAMEQHLEAALSDIAWPRETHASFEIRDGGEFVALDVDLPEVEDMPRKSWTVPARGFAIKGRDIPESQINNAYAAHVHGIGFRLAGEVFAVLPKVQTILLSAYSQRSNPAIGTIADQYLYSVRIARAQWSQINFQNLRALDVIEALDQFELRRDMAKNGRFKPIEPFAIA